MRAPDTSACIHVTAVTPPAGLLPLITPTAHLGALEPQDLLRQLLGRGCRGIGGQAHRAVQGHRHQLLHLLRHGGWEVWVE